MSRLGAQPAPAGSPGLGGPRSGSVRAPGPSFRSGWRERSTGSARRCSSRATILVLSVDEADRLAACLPAALAQPDARVVVIDNACEDGTVALCRELGVEVVPVRPRRSYAAAINAGLAATTGDVLLLNADCVLAPDFLEPARRALAHEGIGSVAPKLVRATGMREEDRLKLLDTAGMGIDRRRKNGLVGHGRPASEYAHRAPAFGGDGACVLYRREVLDACAVGVEVLDEDMALWASDADLAWRAQVLGWGCTYEPEALAWHMRFYSPTTRAALSEEHRRLQFTNRLLMLAKNETLGGLVRHAPWILGYELLALGHVLLRERHLLGGYRDAIRRWPAARRRRREMRAAVARPPFGLTPPR